MPRALDPDLAQEDDSMVTDTLTRAADPGARLATVLRKGAVCMELFAAS